MKSKDAFNPEISSLRLRFTPANGEETALRLTLIDTCYLEPKLSYVCGDTLFVPLSGRYEFRNEEKK